MHESSVLEFVCDACMNINEPEKRQTYIYRCYTNQHQASIACMHYTFTGMTIYHNLFGRVIYVKIAWFSI